MKRAQVFRLSMAHPGDLSALDALISDGTIRAADVVAIIGKTEGNGGVNDFTRGYFTQTLMALLSAHLKKPASQLIQRNSVRAVGRHRRRDEPALQRVLRQRGASDHAAIFSGACDRTAFAPVATEDVGRRAHVESVAAAVRQAIANAGIEKLEDVHFVQVKCPCVTVARASAAIAAGKPPRTIESQPSMAFARAAGAFGVALALDEIKPDGFNDDSLLADFTIQSPRASISSGRRGREQRGDRARQQPGTGAAI